MYLYAVVDDGEYVYQSEISYYGPSTAAPQNQKIILIPSIDLFHHAGKKMSLWYTINTGSNDDGNLYKSSINSIDIPMVFVARPAEILNGSIIPLTSTAGTGNASLGNYWLRMLIPPYIGKGVGDAVIVTLANDKESVIYTCKLIITEDTAENEIEIKLENLDDFSKIFAKTSTNQFIYFRYAAFKADGRMINGEMNILKYY